MSAEVMEGLERRAAKTGSLVELARIAPHRLGPSAGQATKTVPLTPEQISRAALGSLHPSRAAENAATVDKLSVQARREALREGV